MLNYIWAGMILLGVIYGVCTGQMSALTGGALDSAREAVSLCITMAGVMLHGLGVESLESHAHDLVALVDAMLMQRVITGRLFPLLLFRPIRFQLLRLFMMVLVII